MFVSGGNDKHVCVCNADNVNCMCDVHTSCPRAETLEVLFPNELGDMISAQDGN